MTILQNIFNNTSSSERSKRSDLKEVKESIQKEHFLPTIILKLSADCSKYFFQDYDNP